MEQIVKLKLLGDILGIKGVEKILRRSGLRIIDSSQPIHNQMDDGFHMFLTVRFTVESET